jgi:genome maintenance exonuclease 1
MLLKNKIDYIKLKRIQTAEGRQYVGEDNNPVPSVTTILGDTGDKTALIEWRKRVGDEEANRISKESAGLGTKVHNAIEKHILGEAVEFGNNQISIMAKEMSELMINEGFKNVNEVWGTEVGLIAPGLYAGTTDCVGLHQGEEAIIDFKTSKKIKKEEWIEDYYLQCCAYALAHNEMYGTNIKKGVILMVSRDNKFKEFVIEGARFDMYCEVWAQRLADYYGKV